MGCNEILVLVIKCNQFGKVLCIIRECVGLWFFQNNCGFFIGLDHKGIENDAFQSIRQYCVRITERDFIYILNDLYLFPMRFYEKTVSFCFKNITDCFPQWFMGLNERYQIFTEGRF